VNYSDDKTVSEEQRTTPEVWTINYAKRTINWTKHRIYDQAFKKRERTIKNTRFYTGSPFLKGYVQSFVNQQRIPLIKINKISLHKTNPLVTN